MHAHHFTHDRTSRWVLRLCAWVCRHARRHRIRLAARAVPEVATA